MSVSMIARNSPLETRQKEYRSSIFREISQLQKRTKVQIKPRTRVEDLVANRPVGRLEVLILRRYPRRTITSKGWKGSVAAACGRDETGLIGVVLWGDQVDQVRTGDVISIEGGWCRYSHGQKVVSTGRTGRLTVLEA
jgi:ssDNA-binding replication factor A large subunit